MAIGTCGIGGPSVSRNEVITQGLTVSDNTIASTQFVANSFANFNGYSGVSLPSASISSATWASTGGGQVTFVTSIQPWTSLGVPITTGSTFSVVGMVPAGYNGTYTAIAGTSGATLVAVLTTNPGTTVKLGTLTLTSGSAANTGPYPFISGKDGFDVGGNILLHPQQNAIYIYGAFASTAYFDTTGNNSWGWSIGLLSNNQTGWIYTTSSFTVGPNTTTGTVWDPSWTYLQNPVTAAGKTPSFSTGPAIGWNFLNGGLSTNLVSGETSFLNYPGSVTGSADFHFANWDGSSVATTLCLMTKTSSLFAGTNSVTTAFSGAGTLYPNINNIGQVNINSGSNADILVLGSSAVNTSISTYYAGPVLFWQLMDSQGITKVTTTSISGGNFSYNNGSGVTTIILPSSPGISSGQTFILSGITSGTGGGAYTSLNGNWTATVGTSGTTINFTATSGLGTITSITGATITVQGCNANNATAALDWRANNYGQNSFASIVAQCTGNTVSGTSGILSFLVANNAGAGTEAMRIQTSGGVSIGTTSDPGVGLIYQNSASFLMRTKTSWTNGAGGSTGTLTNAPAGTNPTKWIPVDDNGTTRYIPAW